MADLTILGIPGSLRTKSYAYGLLIAARELAPPGTRVEVGDIRGFPVFNQDDAGHDPDPVRALREKVRSADAVLFSLNEHNYGLSAAEKNAIDWLSFPPGQNVWDGKPAGIMSASVGMIGGARAQYQLRQTMVYVNMFPINRPEVIVTFAHDKFDANGRLTDATARKFVGEHLAELARFARRLHGSG